jgi:nitronate monooxygenase
LRYGRNAARWNNNRLAAKFRIDYPVIQRCPFGGLSSQKSTAAAPTLADSDRSLLIAGAITDVKAEIRPLKSKPFAMNLWVLMEYEGARTELIRTMAKLTWCLFA